MPLPRTTYLQIVARRAPNIVFWAGGLTTFFAWPHIYGAVSDKMHHVPRVNWNII